MGSDHKPSTGLQKQGEEAGRRLAWQPLAAPACSDFNPRHVLRPRRKMKTTDQAVPGASTLTPEACKALHGALAAAHEGEAAGEVVTHSHPDRGKDTCFPLLLSHPPTSPRASIEQARTAVEPSVCPHKGTFQRRPSSKA